MPLTRRPHGLEGRSEKIFSSVQLYDITQTNCGNDSKEVEGGLVMSDERTHLTDSNSSAWRQKKNAPTYLAFQDG